MYVFQNIYKDRYIYLDNYFFYRQIKKMQEYEQPEMYDSSPAPVVEDSEFIKFQIDVEKDLDKFTQEVLRGKVEIQNPETGEKKWEPIAPNEKAPMNELGVRGILVLMKGAVTKISKLSCKTDDEIKNDMYYFHMTLMSAFYNNLDRWEIGLNDVEAIKESALRMVWDVAASSRDGFTAINLRSQYSRTESTRGESIPRTQKSFLGIPMGK